ncbi:bZIP transcription factor [Cercospora zeina]
MTRRAPSFHDMELPIGPPAPYSSHGQQTHGAGDAANAAATATAAAALSQDHIPTPNATNSRKRRATGAPGSRGVANLTPEQLAKKRANDREAQRAIRERTRNTIEGLERRIRELESQQPFQDLQRVVQERDRALAECEELRRRLGAVAGIAGAASQQQQQHPSLNGTFTFEQLIDPSLLTDDDVELAALTAQQSPLPPLTALDQSSYSQEHGHRHSEQPQQNSNLHPQLRSPGTESSGQTPPVGHSTDSSISAYDNGDADAGRNAVPHHHAQSPNEGRYDQRRQTSAQSHHHSRGDRLGLSYLLDNAQQPQEASASPSTPSLQPSRSPDLPVYARISNVGPPSCPLDSLLIDALRSRRKMMQDGASVQEAIGPDYPAFAAMVDPGDGNRRSECHQLSALLIDIISKFPDIAQLPEKVAVLYVMFLVLRWLICPCEKCYERLPEWYRPTAVQLENPHFAWTDYVPWPYMRSQLALREGQVKFEDFFVPYTTELSLNWPLPYDCVLLRSSSDGAALELNPAFEHHLRDLKNWSLGPRFAQTFPMLVDGTVRIKDV